MRNNIKFIFLLTRLKLSHMMVFRLSFFGAFFADGILFLTQLLVFNIVYSHIDSIGDWSRGQMLIFIGTFSMINGLNMLIYFFGINDIPRKIREGTLDTYITKPINPLLRLTFESVNIGSAPLLILSGAIIAYGAAVEGVVFTLQNILGYSALVLIMTLLWYDMEIILRSLPFFFISASAIESLEGNMLELNFKIPGVLFKGVFRVLFWLIMPYGIMATVPTQYLSGALTTPGLIYALDVAAGFTAFALCFWKIGLRNYKSASS